MGESEHDNTWPPPCIPKVNLVNVAKLNSNFLNLNPNPNLTPKPQPLPQPQLNLSLAQLQPQLVLDLLHFWVLLHLFIFGVVLTLVDYYLQVLKYENMTMRYFVIFVSVLAQYKVLVAPGYKYFQSTIQVGGEVIRALKPNNQNYFTIIHRRFTTTSHPAFHKSVLNIPESVGHLQNFSTKRLFLSPNFCEPPTTNRFLELFAGCLKINQEMFCR